MATTVSIGIALLLLTLTAEGVGAQSSRAAVPADSVPLSIREAEESGARFPSLIQRVPLPPQFTETSVHGSPERRCVRVGNASVVRAGDFLIGPFATPIRPWSLKKLWWVPASYPGELRVAAVPLDGSARPIVFMQPLVARARPPLPDSSGAFHPSLISIHDRGEWMLLATSGTSWGCILVRVG